MLNGFACAAVMAAVLAAPWLFGCAEAWARLLVCVLASMGVAAWLFGLVARGKARLRAPVLTVLLLALPAYAALQMMPLPLGVVRAVSPSSARAQSARLEVFGRIGVQEFLPANAAGGGAAATISASPAATQHTVCLLAACIGAFLVLANTLRDWRSVRNAATAIAVSGFVMVVLALMQRLSGTQAIYWFHEPRYGGDVFGPFTNRNHYAAYMNMSLGVTLGLLLSAARARRAPGVHSWWQGLAWPSKGSAPRMALLAFAAVLMAASVLVSLSRGGIASLVAGTAVVGVLTAGRGVAAGRRSAVAIVVLLVVVAVAWLGWRPIVDRLGTIAAVARDPLHDSRALATADTMRLFAASPLVGHGFGAFEYVFPAFQSPAIQVGRWVHAHNDYAELLAEGGLLGALIAAACAGAFVADVRRGFWRAAGKARSMVAGLSVGLVAIALHSFVDFSLHRLPNGLLLAAVCGLCVAAVHVPEDSRGRTGRDSGAASAEEAAFAGAGL